MAPRDQPGELAFSSRQATAFCHYQQIPVLLLTLFLTGFCAVSGLEEPCVAPGISSADLSDLLNPRPSADGAVLLNLPFSRLFCSTAVARYLVIGDWQQRSRLSASQPFSSAGFANIGTRTDVTSASSAAEFDFRPELSLTENATYFAALVSCNPWLCRTLGPVEFRPWRLLQNDPNLAVKIAVPAAAFFLAAIVVAVLIYKCRRTSQPGDGNHGDQGGRERRDGQTDSLGLRMRNDYVYADQAPAPDDDDSRSSSLYANESSLNEVPTDCDNETNTVPQGIQNLVYTQADKLATAHDSSLSQAESSAQRLFDGAENECYDQAV